MLGTPTEDTWPGISLLPDYKAFPAHQPNMSLSQVVRLYGSLSSTVMILSKYFQVVPKLGNRGRDLLQRLLVCNPMGRMSADEAMAHQYFNDLSPAIKNERC